MLRLSRLSTVRAPVPRPLVPLASVSSQRVMYMIPFSVTQSSYDCCRSMASTNNNNNDNKSSSSFFSRVMDQADRVTSSAADVVNRGRDAASSLADRSRGAIEQGRDVVSRGTEVVKKGVEVTSRVVEDTKKAVANSNIIDDVRSKAPSMDQVVTRANEVREQAGRVIEDKVKPAVSFGWGRAYRYGMIAAVLFGLFSAAQLAGALKPWAPVVHELVKGKNKGSNDASNKNNATSADNNAGEAAPPRRSNNS
jgi:hypothetical protein